MTKPRLCLVTDRRRLAAVLRAPESQALALLRQQIEGAVAGAIDLVQIRERDLDARVLAQLTRDIVALCRGTSTRVVVNDRVDVALAAGAAGVHLRETSISAADARRLWPQALTGRSVHQSSSIDADADYLIAGTVFASQSKGDGAPTIGGAGLAAIVRAAGATPVLAIGGITATTVGEVARAGATGVAAIGAFMPDEGERDVATAVQKKVEKLRFGFDSASTVS